MEHLVNHGHKKKKKFKDFGAILELVKLRRHKNDDVIELCVHIKYFE
jgi:hypothetical protein